MIKAAFEAGLTKIQFCEGRPDAGSFNQTCELDAELLSRAIIENLPALTVSLTIKKLLAAYRITP